MDKTKILETKRLRIRFAKTSDIDYILGLEHHPDHRDFVWQGTTEQHTNEIIDPDYALQVFEKQDDHERIGYSLSWYNQQSHWVELRRIVITDKGRGYGTEAMEALFDFFFQDLTANKVWLDVYPHNTTGIRLYEKLGMKLDGVLRDNYYSERLGYLDQVVYSMLRSEYELKKR